MRPLKWAALVAALVLASCGGEDSATKETGRDYITALGQADCSNLLVEGEVSDGWAENPPVPNLPPEQRTPNHILAAARENADELSGETQEAYIAGCRKALN
jgi:hypothetical protein